MKETVIQFGTGNFLRGFADNFIDILNKKELYDGKIVIVQPTKGGKADIINKQGGKYNLFLRGIENGVEKCVHSEITSVSRGVDPYKNFEAYMALAENPDMRFIISNTTEAGIAYDESCKFLDRPALSFPGKLTQLLFRRFQMSLTGFVILCCELIDNNGKTLKKLVLRYARAWDLGEDFYKWINSENIFCDTLVDRIVSGYSKTDADRLFEKTGFDDNLLDAAELFHLWVIEGDFEKELPLKKAGVNVIWTNDVSAYKKMKVRILNGSHTCLVFPSLLCGIDSVSESLNDEQIKKYLNICLFDYILPVLGETQENKAFARSVLERFANPYIRHQWKSIALNSVGKFTVRVLPTIKDYFLKNDVLPKPLVFSLSALIEYYKTNDIQDDTKTVEFIKENSVRIILSSVSLWGEDLSFMSEIVSEGLDKIRRLGIRRALEWAVS